MYIITHFGQTLVSVLLSIGKPPFVAAARALASTFPSGDRDSADQIACEPAQPDMRKQIARSYPVAGSRTAILLSGVWLALRAAMVLQNTQVSDLIVGTFGHRSGKKLAFDLFCSLVRSWIGRIHEF
jgi:hypothetical protein